MSLQGTNVADNQSVNSAAVAIGFIAGMGSSAVLPAAMAPAAGATFAAMVTVLNSPSDHAFLAVPNALLGGIVGTIVGPLTTSLAVGYAAYVVADSVIECLQPKQAILNQYDRNKKSSTDKKDISLKSETKKSLKL